MRHWTEKEKKKQACAIRRWKPWTKSTGPRSTEGKTISCMNARKHGFRAAGWRNLRAAMAQQKRFLNVVNALIKHKRWRHKVQKSEKLANELLNACEIFVLRHPARRQIYPSAPDRPLLMVGKT